MHHGIIYSQCIAYRWRTITGSLHLVLSSMYQKLTVNRGTWCIENWCDRALDQATVCDTLGMKMCIPSFLLTSFCAQINSCSKCSKLLTVDQCSYEMFCHESGLINNIVVVSGELHIVLSNNLSEITNTLWYITSHLLSELGKVEPQLPDGHQVYSVQDRIEYLVAALCNTAQVRIIKHTSSGWYKIWVTALQTVNIHIEFNAQTVMPAFQLLWYD